MTSPFPDVQLDAQDVINELISTEQGRMLWENAQLKVLAMRQNRAMIEMQAKIDELSKNE